MNAETRLTPQQVAAASQRLREAIRLQEIEGNPLDAEDIAMFEMFEREAWPHEKCTAYILERARKSASPEAAE